MIRIFALTTRGLETVSAEEIATLPGVTVEQTSYRRVGATCSGSLKPLLGLRTADDVFIDVATWLGIDHRRGALAALNDMSAQIDLYKAAAVCSGIRPVHRPPTFSVTASFVGKRNYSTDEIKETCARGIGVSHYGWAYTEDDREADLNVRLFIEHETARVGVRLGREPLQNRPYKQVHVPGSLKPPVAAALHRLAEAAPGLRVLDPCCGAGTILIEGAMGGSEAQGGDNDPGAVAAAKANANAADVRAKVRLWDAGALPIADSSVDRVVSNLPWGRKVSVDSNLNTLYARIGTEVCRVLAPEGRAAILTNAPRLVNSWKLRCEKQIEISLFGQRPTITIFSRR
jgi:23S rRNA G2445 N2-methylase RlmL